MTPYLTHAPRNAAMLVTVSLYVGFSNLYPNNTADVTYNASATVLRRQMVLQLSLQIITNTVAPRVLLFLTLPLLILTILILIIVTL